MGLCRDRGEWDKSYVWTLNKIWTQVFDIVIHLTQGGSNFPKKTQSRPAQLSCWSAFHPRKHLRYSRWQARDNELVHTHCHGRNDGILPQIALKLVELLAALFAKLNVYANRGLPTPTGSYVESLPVSFAKLSPCKQ